MIKLVVTEITT